MSGIDVLAVLDREIEAIRNTKQIVDYSLSPERQRAYAEHLEILIESRVAVAELIEADKAYDKAESAMDRESGYTPEHIIAINTFRAASDRRRAAIAKATGGDA